jgi:hypothetical protein
VLFWLPALIDIDQKSVAEGPDFVVVDHNGGAVIIDVKIWYILSDVLKTIGTDYSGTVEIPIKSQFIFN